MVDIALAQDEDGEVVLHKADCPAVRKMADAGLPVMTMSGCDGPLPEGYIKHECLNDV
jgi:hypothetical protein